LFGYFKNALYCSYCSYLFILDSTTNVLIIFRQDLSIFPFLIMTHFNLCKVDHLIVYFLISCFIFKANYCGIFVSVLVIFGLFIQLYSFYFGDLLKS
jgi:hypothetical protein